MDVQKSALTNDLATIKSRVRELETLIMLNAKIAMQTDLDGLLQTIVDCARDLIGACMGGLVVVNPERSQPLQYFKVSGVSSSNQLPSGHGLFMVPYRTGQPVRVDRVRNTMPAIQPIGHPQLGPFLGVPLKARDKLLGSLFLAQSPGSAPFSLEDQNLLSAFATQATIAIDNAQVRDNLEYMKILEERERISQGLHSSVAQVLFLLKLELERSRKTPEADYPELIDRLGFMQQLAEQGLNDIKTAIFSLSEPISTTPDLSRALHQMVDSFAGTSGIDSKLLIKGLVHNIPEQVGQLLTKVVGESLNNIQKHSQSPVALISIVAYSQWVMATVQDAGIGIPADIQTQIHMPSSRYGLRAMQSLTTHAGGTFTIFINDEGGTTVRVAIPYAAHP